MKSPTIPQGRFFGSLGVEAEVEGRLPEGLNQGHFGPFGLAFRHVFVDVFFFVG